MAYDRRKVDKLRVVDSIVVSATITYESDIGTGEFEDYGGAEIVTTLRSAFTINEEYIDRGGTIFREHFSDILTDAPTIIGQNIDDVETDLGLSPLEARIAVAPT